VRHVYAIHYLVCIDSYHLVSEWLLFNANSAICQLYQVNFHKTIQRKCQHMVHKTKKNKAKTQYIMCWTPLCAGKHKYCYYFRAIPLFSLGSQKKKGEKEKVKQKLKTEMMCSRRLSSCLTRDTHRVKRHEHYHIWK
jgi:hypothetical protein